VLRELAGDALQKVAGLRSSPYLASPIAGAEAKALELYGPNSWTQQGWFSILICLIFSKVQADNSYSTKSSLVEPSPQHRGDSVPDYGVLQAGRRKELVISYLHRVSTWELGTAESFLMLPLFYRGKNKFLTETVCESHGMTVSSLIMFVFTINGESFCPFSEVRPRRQWQSLLRCFFKYRIN